MSDDPNGFINGTRVMEDDERRVEFFIENGLLRKIEIEVKNDDFFPHCNVSDKRLFVRWLQWTYSMLETAMMKVPTQNYEKRVGKEILDNVLSEPAALGPTPREINNPDLGQHNLNSPSGLNETLAKAGKFVLVNCPSCNSQVMARHNCCKPEYNGICSSCRTKVRVEDGKEPA